jgi:nucleotidyltransferase substrate binding protein (TIGR01987 family)
MPLDLTSFEKAVVSLEEVLQAHAAVKDTVTGEFLRDAVIKRFEYTFELSWKFLKRYIEVYGLERPDGFTHKELFRVGFEQGMIRDSAPWFEYLKKRNLTSHTYDKNVAEDVFRSAAPFLQDASYLLARLREKAK